MGFDLLNWKDKRVRRPQVCAQGGQATWRSSSSGTGSHACTLQTAAPDAGLAGVIDAEQTFRNQMKLLR